MDYAPRRIGLHSVLADHGLDALLVTYLPNIRYLSGFTGSSAALLITGKDAVFFTDGRYAEQARREVQGARVRIARKAPLTAAAEWLAAHSVSKGKFRLGFEPSRLSWEAHRQLISILPSNYRLRPAPALIEQFRMTKDAGEIAHIRAAAALGASLFEIVLEALHPGAKESDVAARMEFAARQSGAEGMSFPTIVVAGQRSALPHGQPGSHPIPANGFVVCDFGVILSGYCSDRTRTVHMGRPSREARGSYEAVRAAQAEAVQAVAPGQTASEVDRIARKVLQKNRLGKYFTHSTGHGVGLEIHEAPRIAAAQDTVLQPGMIITVEPGIYLPRKWGVRIEDMVLVTEKGREILAPSSTELIAL